MNERPRWCPEVTGRPTFRDVGHREQLAGLSALEAFTDRTEPCVLQRCQEHPAWRQRQAWLSQLPGSLLLWERRDLGEHWTPLAAAERNGPLKGPQPPLAMSHQHARAPGIRPPHFFVS